MQKFTICVFTVVQDEFFTINLQKKTGPFSQPLNFQTKN